MDDELLNENEFRRFKQKDQQVFKKVYDKYFNLIHYVSRRCGVDSFASDDIVQETFIRLYNHSEKIYEPGKIKSWLVTTARNLCMDQARKRTTENSYKKGETQKVADDEVITLATVANNTLASDNEIKELELALIGKLIDKVTSETKDETFSLFYRDGLSARAIAEKQDTPLSTITNRLSRLRKRFQNNFEAHIKQLHEEIL